MGGRGGARRREEKKPTGGGEEEGDGGWKRPREVVREEGWEREEWPETVMDMGGAESSGAWSS
jgi:hypothetical protein